MANVKLDWKSVLCGLLDCGYLDLMILEDADEDCVCDAIDELKAEGLEVTLNGITSMMFSQAKWKLDEAVQNRIEELEGMEIIDDAEAAELEAIRELEVESDIQGWSNCLDTSISMVCEDWKIAIYEKYFSEVIDELEANMGFDIVR